MNTKISPHELNGKINAILSKSDVHRSLICAALSDKPSHIQYESGIYEDELSIDIEITLNCLKTMGAEFVFQKGSLQVKPITVRNIPKKYSLDCGESGSTLRFMLPLCSAFGHTFHVTGSGRLPDRPVIEIIEQMREHGCIIEEDTLPLEVAGALKPGHYLLPGNVSSQYLSGFLFTLPLLERDSLIELTTELESKSYVDMTVNKLGQFNIGLEQNTKEYKVYGDQIYRTPGSVIVEGDWSNSAFWLSAGALSSEGITCNNLDVNSLQPDSAIYPILKKIGADIKENDAGIHVRKNKLNPINMDASQCPDLVPVVAVILSVCPGKSEIINAGRLRVKESDRLKAISENLKILGADIEESTDKLTINGVEKLRGGMVNGWNDHRIVMAMAIASMVCEREITITGSDAIKKSYKNFFLDFEKLGGISNVI